MRAEIAVFVGDRKLKAKPFLHSSISVAREWLAFSNSICFPRTRVRHYLSMIFFRKNYCAFKFNLINHRTIVTTSNVWDKSSSLSYSSLIFHKMWLLFGAYKQINLTVLKHNINREAFLYRKPKKIGNISITNNHCRGWDGKKMATEVQCALKRLLSIWTLIPKQSFFVLQHIALLY